MQTSIRKSKLIALAISIFASGAILLQTVTRSVLGIGQYPLGPHSLATLKVFLIIMSAYGLISAWLIQFWRKTILDRISKGRKLPLLTPEAAYLLMGHLLLISPVIYSYLLYICGMPLREYFYYVGASMAMTLARAISDLRKL